jgi:hypothetical protein
MEILGYSERGIVNSLFYEIKYNEEPERLLREFIGMIYFPQNNEKINLPDKDKDFDVEILIEQSFSEFGDPDIVLIICDTSSGTRSKQVVFGEAKVNNWKNNFTLKREYEKFQKGKNIIGNDSDPGRGFSSNLFTQIYHKWMLIETLIEKDGIAQLENGIELPLRSSPSKPKISKIGTNNVVRKAIEKLQDYDLSFFVSIIPESLPDIKKFIEGTDWNSEKIKNWGFLSWKDVDTFCKKNNLAETLMTFDFNKGVIY